MKIILLTSSLGAGGAERVATTLCNAWAARGDKVTLLPTYSGGGKAFYVVSSDVELIFLADFVNKTHKSLLSYFLRLRALRGLIKKSDPAVVIAFLPNVNAAAILACGFLNTPVIICERRDPESQPGSWAWEMLLKMLYRFASMLTVQTDVVSKNIHKIYPGLKSVRVVSNPLPQDIVGIKRIETDSPRKVLLSVGRLSTEKQVSMAIDVFGLCASQFSEWDFHIYGDGPLRQDLECQIQRLGLQDRVFLKGRTTEPWQVMAESDAFIMVSRFEGFPNSLLEAMGVGLPCVVFDCPSGPREITCDGVDALLVPLNNAIKLQVALSHIMENDVFARSLGEQARRSVISRYSLSSTLARWDELFSEVGVKP